MLTDYPLYYLLFCLFAGAAYAAVLYFIGRRHFSRGWQWGLAMLRFTAVSAIAFLLLAPLMKQTLTERQLPHVVLARDISASVAQSADSAFNLAPLEKQLEGRCRISVETFGDAGSTDIGGLLARHRGDDVAALVLASDGIHNRGTNPVTAAEQLAFPIYCIALGDTTPRRDAAVGALRCNRIAMLGSRFPVEATVTASLLGGHSASLTILDSKGRSLQRTPIAYPGDDYSATFTFNIEATEAGLQRFDLLLSAADGETSLSNNRLTFYVDVIDTRRRIAVIANAPHPDLAAIKHALEDSPTYEADIIMADKAESGRWKAEGYSLAILHNLPSARHTSIAYIGDLPAIYVLGLQTDLARFNALHTGLEITAQSTHTNEVTAIYNPAFSLFSLDAGDAAVLEELPPLSAPFGESRMTADMQTLFGARLGRIDTREPLVAATATGEQRRTMIWGEGLWRWRLADYQTHHTHSHVDQFIAQLVSFTALQANRDRLRIDAERTYSAGEPITLRAELYNEAYQLTNTPEVGLVLTGDSLKADYTFRRNGNNYALTLPGLGEGLYRYRATTADGLSAEGSFAVEALNTEQQRLTADHTLLRTLADLTGGSLVSPQELATLHSQLSTLKPTLYTRTRYAEVLRMPLILALILLLLAAEWILRKYQGEL